MLVICQRSGGSAPNFHRANTVLFLSPRLLGQQQPNGWSHPDTRVRPGAIRIQGFGYKSLWLDPDRLQTGIRFQHGQSWLSVPPIWLICNYLSTTVLSTLLENCAIPRKRPQRSLFFRVRNLDA